MNLDGYRLEENFSRHGPMFYNRLFSEEYRTGKYKLLPETFPIGNLKDKIKIVIKKIHHNLIIKMMA